MTEDNKFANIALEVAKAERSLQSAQLLLNEALLDDAVSRAYYGAFHYARALMLMDGLEAKSHGGVIHLLNLHFVRTGRLPPELADALAHLQVRRERADYDVAAVFSEGMASEALAKARALAAAVRQLLQEGKYL